MKKLVIALANGFGFGHAPVASGTNVQARWFVAVAVCMVKTGPGRASGAPPSPVASGSAAAGM